MSREKMLEKVARSVAAIGFHTLPKGKECKCILCEMAREARAALSAPVQQQAAQVPKCPFPCGWNNLYSRIITDAAFLARGLVEGELVTERQREVVMHMISTAKALCSSAMLAAAPQPPASEAKDAELLEAAEAVVARWDTPLWKDAQPTAVFIGRLRAAIAEQKGGA